MPEEPIAEEGEELPPMTAASLLDSWMLQHFPGRFLDEIDTSMDIFRFLRALQARAIEGVEALRKRFLDKKIEAKDIPGDQWETIAKHDKLIDQLCEFCDNHE